MLIEEAIKRLEGMLLASVGSFNKSIVEGLNPDSPISSDEDETETFWSCFEKDLEAYRIAITALKTQLSQEATTSSTADTTNSTTYSTIDLISRQAAIDAVDAIGHIATMPDGDKCIRRSAVKYTLSMLPPAQPDVPDTNVGDIDKFIDGLEEIFADLRERHVDNSVCGLCEYDGAYIGQSGDWCNECPGFERDDCFKLSDKTRKEWTEEIIKALLTAQPQQKWIPVSERLPELDEDGYSQKVLACFGNCSGCDILEYRATEGIGKWYIGDMDDSPEDIGVMVLAWMPLPEPYKGVER